MVSTSSVPRRLLVVLASVSLFGGSIALAALHRVEAGGAALFGPGRRSEPAAVPGELGVVAAARERLLAPERQAGAVVGEAWSRSLPAPLVRIEGPPQPADAVPPELAIAALGSFAGGGSSTPAGMGPTGEPAGVRWVNSINAGGGPPPYLRAVPGKGVAIVGGYARVGDGGGGVFQWDATATGGDNDGTIIVPALSPRGRWVRLYSGAVNARWFGAGLGSGQDSQKIANALAVLAAAGGGELFFPNGTYAPTSPIVLGSGMVLRGESMGCRIVPGSGSFDTVTVPGSLTAPLGNITLQTFYFAEAGKTGGNSVLAQYVSRLTIRDCQFDSPPAGMRLHNFNTVLVQQVRIAGVRAGNSYGFWLTGDNNGGSDVASFQDVVVQGGAPSTHSKHGMIVDGRVNTLSAHKLYLVNSDGAGIWFRNTMGTLENPQFATFYGLEVDFPYLEAVAISVGRQLYFTDAQMHGSATRANVTIASGASVVAFRGGFSHGAAGAGFDVSGQQVTISGMDVYANSLASTSVYSGIQLNATSRMVTVDSNKCGDPATATQYAGIRVFAGADQFAIVGNTCYYNTIGISNAAGTGTSRVVTGNAN